MDNHHLVRMANQIGDFFDSMPCRDEAVAGISDHIKRFWAPRMRRQLLDHLESSSGEGLSDIVRESLTRNRELLTPA